MVVTRALGASAALLLALSASACSADGSGSPDDASVEDFCGAYFYLFSGGMDAVDPAAPQAEQEAAMIEALRAWADELDEVGTPAGIPAEARAGFELLVASVSGLDPGDVDNLAELDDDFTEAEMAATRAFEEYAAQNCESPFGDPPTA